MKGTITQYVALGVMLLIMILIVSLYPEQHKSSVSSQATPTTQVTKLTIPTRPALTRAD